MYSIFHLRPATILIVHLLLTTGLSAQQLSVTLTGSMHNGSGVPCFGKKEGTITTTVTGGTAPYSYLWSNGETTPNLSGIAAGFYSVEVKDAVAAVVKVEITLTEPEPLKVKPTVSSFDNGENISCFECNNGWIQTGATQGTPPYTYTWDDSPSTSANRYGLGPKEYQVTVTDANGCEESAVVKITQPERSDWTMGGNAGTDPETQYIGTSDNKDLVFKANGQEGIRLKANGDISLMGTLTGDGPLYRRDDGLLGSGFPVYPERPVDRCHGLGSYPYWETRGNAFHQLCEEEDPLLGTLAERPLKIITNGQERMRITHDGKVGIGEAYPEARLHVKGDLLVSTPHGAILSTASAELGATLWARNDNAAWGLSIDPTGTGHILGDINDPEAAMSFNYDRVTINSRLVIGEPTIGPFGAYRLFVDGGIACRDVLVKTGDFPDYVFQPNYALLPIGEFRKYISSESHLPGIPSAAEVDAKGGVEVGDLQVRMLRALEEQALYILQLEERLKLAEQRIEDLNTGK